ncbi:glycosyltransferase family 4 protein [Bacillus sp. REN3]|uniref:glycosyltransferase family 4 protein n=1 Tax=Bacillus sp. REN3 TaxID=2802440 RepID=UPI001AEEC75B|nr:glycosyltransferase family 4 protein [Bacillus sp. REN3]
MKILYVTTISNTVNAFLIPHIRLLLQLGHQVDVAFNIEQDIDPELLKLGCKVYNLGFKRSPIKKQNYFAYKELKKLIKDRGYDLVHTHTPVASVCVRLACKNIKNVKVLYTAHGFHFFKGAPFKNWIIYYPIEWLLSRYTDVLITINKEDYERASKSFKVRKKVMYIPGVGLNIKRFNKIVVDKHDKLDDIGVPENSFLLISVGELNKNKNHETVIKALARIKVSNIFYIITGQGQQERYLEKLIKDLNLQNQVKLLGFRKDIIDLCKIADVFVFPSYREGLSVALMEAMASGLPVVCSNIRGNSDLITDGQNGYLVEPHDIEGFSKSILKLYTSNELRTKFGKSNYKKIYSYSLDSVLKKIEKIYGNI